MWVFAFVTVIALFLSIGSLTTISARQSSLMEAENGMRALQDKISATIFLKAEEAGRDSSNGEKTYSDSLAENVNITPKMILNEYSELKKKLTTARTVISEGDSTATEMLRKRSEESVITSSFAYLVFSLGFQALSTEALLGLLLISCGITGSIMSSMRDGKGYAAKSIILGASVGFVALLGVKSGSTLFIIANSDMNVPFNPYSTAFAGVIAGMFSEKLYIALGRLTDKAFGTDDDETDDVKNAEKGVGENKLNGGEKDNNSNDEESESAASEDSKTAAASKSSTQ